MTQFRTYPQVNALTREQLINEVLRQEQELAREQTRRACDVRNMSDQIAAALARDDVAAARAENVSLQAENERLRELVKAAASAEIGKLRKQLAACKQALAAKGLAEPVEQAEG